MKNLLFLFVIAPLVALSQDRKQKQLQGEIQLTQEIMKECGYRLPEDSLHILQTIREVHALYKVRRIKFVHNGTGTSHFIYPFRTMFLFTQNSLPDSFCVSRLWMGELSHAKQFAERPIRNTWMAVRGFVNAFFVGFFLKKSERKEIKELVAKGCPRIIAWYWVSYRRQYKDSDSFEYQAHSQIEPDLKLAVSYLFAR